MVCRLIWPGVLWTRLAEPLLQVEGSFTLVKRLLEVPVALSTVVPDVGACQ